jgi:hypothetical protein
MKKWVKRIGKGLVMFALGYVTIIFLLDTLTVPSITATAPAILCVGSLALTVFMGWVFYHKKA